MGIYIKNEEMPKSCVKCRWYYELYDEHCTLGKFLLRKYPTDVSEEPYILDTQRHPDCPLEELDLVKCKECKRCEERTTANGLPFLYCLKMEVSVGSNQYCYWGERRE